MSYSSSYATTYVCPATAFQASSFVCRSGSVQASAPAIKGGDKVSIATWSASLMVGPQVVATVPSGERLTVSKIQGPWLWTTTTKDGRNVSGWIRVEDVNLAK